MSLARALLAGCLAVEVTACSSRVPFYVEQPLTRTTPEHDEAKPPPAGVDRPKAPRVESATLSSGMVAHVVERPGSGLVSLVYVNRRARLGTDYLPVFLGDALLAGAYGSDGKVIHPIALAGETPLVLTGPSGTTISITCAARYFDQALELVAALVQRPAFDSRWLGPVRSRTTLDLLRMRSLYGDWSLAMAHADRPFDLSVEQVAEGLRGLDPQALQRAHRELFRPEDSALVVVGAVAPQQALAAFSAKFAGWSGTAAASTTAVVDAGSPAPRVEAAGERSRPKIIVSPSRSYPRVTIVQDAPPPDSDDAVAFELLRGVLAKHGSGSLMKTLRYEQGHAYHVGARAITVPGSGRYLLVETAVADETLAGDVGAMLAVLRRLRSAPIDAQGLASAKASYSARLGVSLSSGEGVARYLAMIRLMEAPALEAVHARLEATSADDLRRCAERYLDPERSTIFVQGDVPASLAGLRALGDVSER